MNIGPRSDGTIPEQVQAVLREVGAWLKVNGRAIYGTRPWRIYGEGPTKVAARSFHDTDTAGYTAKDFRFTSKGNTVYAIELGWPAEGQAVIGSLGSEAMSGQKIASVVLLGSDAKIAFQQQADALRIHLPAEAPGKYLYAFRILFDGSAQLEPRSQKQ